MKKEFDRMPVEYAFNHPPVGHIAPFDRRAAVEDVHEKLRFDFVRTDQGDDVCAVIQEAADQPPSQEAVCACHQDCFPEPEV